MKILLTGGAGYVGSHAARESLRAGHEPMVFDSYVTGHPKSVDGLVQIEGDLRDLSSIRSVFEKFRFDAVLHCGTLNTVQKSVEDPPAHDDSIAGTLNLLRVMREARVERLIFSSTAAVYGNPDEVPIPESHRTDPVDPHGRSMLRIEQMLGEIAKQTKLRYIALRHFNVAGADPWGDIGEDHPGESHLIPRLLLTALKRFECFEIFGTDYDTRDGTCVRDFVHVTDIARAQILALEALERCPNETFNLGSETGYSVRQVVDEVQRLIGTTLPVILTERRAGDPAALVASNQKARTMLGWELEYSDLSTILETAWNWHERHPLGYQDIHYDQLSRRLPSLTGI